MWDLGYHVYRCLSSIVDFGEILHQDIPDHLGHTIYNKQEVIRGLKMTQIMVMCTNEEKMNMCYQACFNS